jgi:ligand-binding sensor domain-containing protein/competence protein ComGC
LSIKSHIVAILSIFIYINALAQSFSVEKFVSNKPLPSAEMYDILEDNMGNKWVASDVGVFKITGNNVEHYTTQNGLEEDVIVKFFEGNDNKIWMAGISGTLGFIQNNQIHKTSVKQKLKDISISKLYINSLIEKKDGSLEFVKTNEQVVYKLKNHQISEIGNLSTTKVIIQLNYEKQPLCFFPTTKDKPIYDWVIQSNGKNYEYPNLFQNNIGQNSKYLKINDSTFYLSNINEVIKFVHFKPTERYTLPLDVFGLSYINQKVYCQAHNHGIYILENNKTIKVDIPILNDLSVSKMLPDKEGNIWFTTLEKGLFVCRFPKMQITYQGKKYVVKFLKNDSVQILLANNTLLNRQNIYQPLIEKTNVINDVIFLKNQKIYITNAGLWDADKSKYLQSKAFFMKGYQRMNVNNYLIFGSSNLHIFNSELYTLEFKKSLSDKILCVEKIDENTAWAGCLNAGIYEINISQNTSKHIIKNVRINTIRYMENDKIAIGTNQNGVLIANRLGNITDSIANLPQRIECLAYQEKILYIGTRIGLYVYNTSTKQIKIYNSSNLLPFDEIVDLKITSDNQINIAGRYEALQTHTSNLLKNSLNIQLSIENTSLPFKNNLIKLRPKENFTITCSQNNYKASQNAVFYFVVTNDQGKVIKTQQTKSNIFEMGFEAGHYQLKMYVFDKFLLSKSNEITIKIDVPAFFYQTWWFILLMSLIVLIIISFIIWLIVKNIERRELHKRMIQQKISDLESKALQAQMNPHFIFNAINSIQSFILQNKRKEANFYLTEFAKLIRMILNNSRKKDVSIQEEIKLLKIYTQLESQRLTSPIHFVIEVDSQIDMQDVIIPTMLLQPIVENAIWHGLSEVENDKILKIEFLKKNDTLVIRIFNNGKPFVSNQNESKEHTSQGLQIIKDRIALFYKKEPDFKYFYILNVENGVEVCMLLPLITVYD